MKQSIVNLRLQSGLLFLAFLMELPFGFIVMLSFFVQTVAETPLGQVIYDLPSSHWVWRLLSEQVLMPAGLVAFPLTLLFLLGVLLGIVLSSRKQPEIKADCMWTFLMGILYAFFPVFFMLFGFPTLGAVCMVIFAAFHGMLLYHLWLYYRAIRQKKKKQAVQMTDGTAVE